MQHAWTARRRRAAFCGHAGATGLADAALANGAILLHALCCASAKTGAQLRCMMCLTIVKCTTQTARLVTCHAPPYTICAICVSSSTPRAPSTRTPRQHLPLCAEFVRYKLVLKGLGLEAPRSASVSGGPHGSRRCGAYLGVPAARRDCSGVGATSGGAERRGASLRRAVGVCALAPAARALLRCLSGRLRLAGAAWARLTRGSMRPGQALQGGCHPCF